MLCLVAVWAQAVIVFSSKTHAASLSGNHSAATQPFWDDYTYCQGMLTVPGELSVLTQITGRIIQPGKTWHPMKDAELIKLQVMQVVGSFRTAQH